VTSRNKYRLLSSKVAIHVLSLFLLAKLYYQALNDQLGADPVEAVIHFTGIGAFNLLLLTLCISPLAKRLKQAWLLQLRRLLGLYSFTYACFHLGNFIAFDLQFAWWLFVDEVIKRPYITIGMIAYILLLSLSITSINKIKRKMGKNWQKLHNVSYVILLLVAMHFYWSVKSEIIEPSIYFSVSLLLLILRKDKIKR
jgi:sulfoxide reductase heme-binding subunit YedZ